MPPAENFVRTHILRGPHAYKNVLLFERVEQQQQQQPEHSNRYPRILFKCLLCNTGSMPKKQVQNHCRGAQHQTNYAALEALVNLPTTTDQTPPESATATEESIGEDNALHRFY